MTALLYLIRRNTKLYFKDKGLFFSSLITPLILLVLYATFLANVYRDSFVSALPEGMQVADSLIDATVGGQLISSLLAVSWQVSRVAEYRVPVWLFQQGSLRVAGLVTR